MNKRKLMVTVDTRVPSKKAPLNAIDASLNAEFTKTVIDNTNLVNIIEDTPKIETAIDDIKPVDIIEDGPKNQSTSEIVLSNLSVPRTHKKILLVPDVPNWAFDNIASAIVKYNPHPDKIEYDIVYAKDLHNDKKVNINDWDLIYVMFEAERILPDGNNIVRGCYSAFWLENTVFTTEKIGNIFSNCRAAVFANPELKRAIFPFLKNNFETAIIYDASDETKFYPIENIKNKEFTVIFVGNTSRPIKNFSTIQHICSQAEVNLEICESVPNKYLIYEYNKADICINFSTFEGGPQTFIEAALCKVPMLIRHTNELSKVIPCFTEETVDDFINALKFLKRNREVCRFKGNEAYNVAIKDFTYKKTAEKFYNFFNSLIKV